MFITYLKTKFHIPSSNGPLVINAKLKVKWKCSHSCHTVLHSAKNYLNKSCLFVKDLLLYIIL